MEMNQDASSRYQDIISKCLKISSGSPAVYQLRPKEEKFGTLTRKTVGEKNEKKTNRTILLVGETGTGKSTLVNALVNYAMGVKFEDNIWFEIVEEEKRGQSESQTSDVIVYEIFGYEDETLPYSLTIIDTPGYGSTRGIEHDVIVSERLFDLFSSEDGVHEIDAVGLVLKATENRVSDRLRYILDSVTSLFGKDMKNIVALITHSNGRRPKNVLKALEAANIKCAKNEENETVHFLFDNCQTEDRTGDTGDLKRADEITTTGMNQFKGFLDETAPQKLEITVDVLDERINLTACMQHLEERIQLTELKQREIQQTEEALKKYEEKKKKYEEEIKKHEEEMKKHEEEKKKHEEEMKKHEEEKKKHEEEMKKHEEEMKKHEEEMKKHEEEMKKHEEEKKKHEEEMKKHEEEMKRHENFTVEVEEVYKEKEVIKGRELVLRFYKRAVTCNICKENCHYPGCTMSVSPKHCKVMKDGHCTVCTNKCPASDHVKEKKIYVTKTRKVQKTLKNLKEKQAEIEELKAKKIKWLDEVYQHVVILEQIALNDNSLFIHVHLDFLIEKMEETGDTEKVKKLREMKSRRDEGTVTDALRSMFSQLTAAGEQHQPAE